MAKTSRKLSHQSSLRSYASRRLTRHSTTRKTISKVKETSEATLIYSPKGTKQLNQYELLDNIGNEKDDLERFIFDGVSPIAPNGMKGRKVKLARNPITGDKVVRSYQINACLYLHSCLIYSLRSNILRP